MPPRFYEPDMPLQGGHHMLTQQTSHHAAVVLRLQRTDRVVLFNGKGHEALATIERTEKQHTHVQCQPAELVMRESPLNITLVQALPSGDKMDWIVEKATELGVTAIQPVQATRSVVRLAGARAEKKQQRWQDIVTAACAQCGRNFLPKVGPIVSYEDWIRQLNTLRAAGQPFFGVLMDVDVQSQRLSAYNWAVQKAHNGYVLIGPEGDFTEAEHALAYQAGFVSANLGPRILRTETAGLAVLAGLQTLCGDF